MLRYVAPILPFAVIGALVACGQPSGCMTTDRGSRVCGSEARDWCRATEDTREIKISLGDEGAERRAKRCEELGA